MRNHPFNVLLLATGGLFIAACPNGNDTNRDANNNDALAGTNKDGPPNLDSTTPSSDAGLACCPSGSILYDCQEPGGGAGFACHNPALGCASSLTCGQGCDPQVSGRCQCVQTDTCALGYHPDTWGSHPCPQVSDDAQPRAGLWHANPAPPSCSLHPYSSKPIGQQASPASGFATPASEFGAQMGQPQGSGFGR